MNLGAFACVIAVGRRSPGQLLGDYRGLASRQPLLAVALAFFLAALAGLPPAVAGLFAKLTVFRAVIDGHLPWLAAVMAVNTVIALYYYATWAFALFGPTTLEPAAARTVPALRHRRDRRHGHGHRGAVGLPRVGPARRRPRHRRPLTRPGLWTILRARSATALGETMYGSDGIPSIVFVGFLLLLAWVVGSGIWRTRVARRIAERNGLDPREAVDDRAARRGWSGGGLRPRRPDRSAAARSYPGPTPRRPRGAARGRQGDRRGVRRRTPAHHRLDLASRRSPAEAWTRSGTSAPLRVHASTGLHAGRQAATGTEKAMVTRPPRPSWNQTLTVAPTSRVLTAASA